MFSLIFLIVFPFALWRAWKNIEMAKASAAWPRVSGTITAAESVKVMFRKQPRVTFSYSVNGAPFTSQRISFAAGYPPRETDVILSRYPIGKEVMVAYAADNPAQAALETGSNRQVTAQMRILLICFVLIVFLNILNFYLSRLNKRTGPLIRSYGVAVFEAGDQYPAVQEEMEILVRKCGMSPMDAIRSATVINAMSMRQEGEMGTIEPGKLANLVFLSANPLDDIAAMRKVTLPVRRGVRYPRNRYRPVTKAELAGRL